MSPLSPTTLAAIERRDAQAILDLINAPAESKERKHLTRAYKALGKVLREADDLTDVEGKRIYDLQVPKHTEVEEAGAFLRKAWEISDLTYTEDLAINSLLHAACFLPGLRQLGLYGGSDLPLNKIAAGLPQLHNLHLGAGTVEIDFGQPLVLPPQLRVLQLESCRLRDLPEEVQAGLTLQTVQLGRNRLRDLPEALLELPQLEVLDLDGNQLQGTLPDNFDGMVCLRDLNLSGNQLTDVSVLGQLPRLSRLNLRDNPLRSLPASLPAVEHLALDGKHLPYAGACLRNSPALRELFLFGGGKVDLSVLTALPQLETLHLEGLHGDLSPVFAMAGLRSLSIIGAGLTSLPDTWDQLPLLEELVIRLNALRDLPPSLLRHRQLRQLNAQNNAFPKGHLRDLQPSVNFEIIR
jgi:Leucine-rich repeat (LRR) protein